MIVFHAWITTHTGKPHTLGQVEVRRLLPLDRAVNVEKPMEYEVTVRHRGEPPRTIGTLWHHRKNGWEELGKLAMEMVAAEARHDRVMPRREKGA